MPKFFTTLSLTTKLVLAFLGICLFFLFILLVIIIPKMERESFESEAMMINRLLSQMEHQILLTIHVNQLYSSSYLEKVHLDVDNHFHEVMQRFQMANPSLQSLSLLKEYLNESFSDLPCSVSILDEKQIISTSQHLENRPNGFPWSDMKPDNWKSKFTVEHPTVCPGGFSEHLLLKEIPNHPYQLGIYCHSHDFLAGRSEFEKSIGDILKRSFKTINEEKSGFVYMMWIDGSKQRCDHQAAYRKSDDPVLRTQHNMVCCVSESSPTQQPLTGTLSPHDLLEAAHSGNPIHHFLDKESDSGHYIYPAITWVRYFEAASRRHPFILAATLYEEDIYQSLDPLLMKFLPAALAAMVGTFGLGLLLFRRFVKNLNRVSKAAKAVKQGNLDARSGIAGEDDIGILGEAFDSMMSALQNSIQTLDNKVTERTSELQTMVAEKEVLLQEVHHRVKNNLAIIIGLIKLKEDRVDSFETKKILQELKERIYAIELLHHKLYQSENLDRIPFQEYALSLIRSITEMNGTNQQKIRTEIEIQPINLNIEQAMACGLIINECMTNSYKYAFNTQEGVIKIKFSRSQNCCILKICDNGQGLPEDFCLKDLPTLGIQLITGIARNQLQGSLRCWNDEGACFEVTFSK